MRKGEIEGRLNPIFYVLNKLDLLDYVYLSSFLEDVFQGETQGTDDTNLSVKVLKVGNFDAFGNIDFENVSYSNFNNRRKLLKKYDIITPFRGMAINNKKFALFAHNERVTIDNNTGVIRLKPEKINPVFVFYYFQTQIGFNQIKKHVVGSAIPAVTKEIIKKIKIPSNYAELQEKVIALFESAYNAKRTKEAEAKILLDSVDAYLLECLGIETPAAAEAKRTFFVRYSSISGNRFDAPAYRQSLNYDSSKFQIEKLSKVAFINPKVSFDKLDGESEISFVPMEVINEHTGAIEESRTKKVSETKGFTRFQENDLIWAKITPCMQNGKSAVARNLRQGFACGSTEFYVIRPRTKAVSVDYLHFLLRNKRVLESAQNFFGGSAGQQRVSVEFLKNFQVPVPPIEIQEEIAAHIQSIRERAGELGREGCEEVERAKAEVERMILGEVAADG